MNAIKRKIPFILPLAVGLSMLISTYLGIDFTQIPGDLADTRFNLFILEHCYQYFSGAVDDFWSAGFMYPEDQVISLSDNLLGSAPFYALFRWVGFNSYTAFQCWIVALAVLNFVSAYLLIAYATKQHLWAGFGAFIFAFSIGLSAQLNHAQTFPRFAIPLCFLFLLLWKDRKSWYWFFLATVSLSYTFYCGIYLGFFTLFPFAIVFIAVVFVNRLHFAEQFRNWRAWITYPLSILFNFALLYKLFKPYISRASGDQPLHTYEQIKHSIPSLESYFSAPLGTLIHGPFENLIGKEYPAFWDHWLFSGWLATIGLLALLMALFAKPFAKRTNLFNQNAWILLFAGGLTFLFFIKINEHSLYYFLHFLPGFGAMRSMTRIINVELLFFGLGLTIALSHFFRQQKSRFFIMLFLLPLLIIDNFVKSDTFFVTPKQEMETRQHQLEQKMQGIPKGQVVSYEPNLDSLDIPPSYLQLDAMLAAQALGLKSVNGYSARAATQFDRFWHTPNAKNRKFWFSRFKAISGDDVYVVK
jgi:hypothetical protein